MARVDLGTEPEKWISLEPDIAESASWTIGALPTVIAEPVEEAPEPVEEVPEEAAEPVQELVPVPVPEVAPPVEEAPPKPPRKPRRRAKPAVPRVRARRRRPRSLLAALLAVLLLAGGLGVGVAVVLGEDPTAAEPAEPDGPGPGAQARAETTAVVADSNGKGHPCTDAGTPGNDLLEGTSGDDVLCGLGGDDVLTGRAGADLLLAGSGDDTVAGGPGTDRLDGGAGKDTLRAHDGSPDEIDGGPGPDQADAGGFDRSTRVESVSDPVVVAAGDIACDPRAGSFEAGLGTAERCRQKYTADLVGRIEPNAVLVLGDVQYEDAQFWKFKRSYHPTWGRFKEISHPTPASDNDRFGGGGYARYWGTRAQPDGSLWYSFDVGGWHLVSLNSNCGLSACAAGSPQEQWLRADLAANPAACTLAFWHEPRFSSAGKSAPKMTAIWQALYEAGAELVLSGDAHNYERFERMDAAGVVDPRGMRQFVVGTGGKSLVPFKERVPGSEKRSAATFGVLKLTLHHRSYEWRFVHESGSRFTDAGSTPCR